jgi:hypothetical protein
VGSVDGYDEHVQFYKDGSSITYGERYRQPIVSIYTTSSSGGSSSYAQTGIPILPNPGGPTHTRILAEWIQSCNEKHQCYPTDNAFLPTRVLDVGHSGADTIRLFCDTENHTIPGKFVALSHQWGSFTQHKKFCTYKNNYDTFQHGIRVTELPKTFRDAVVITRNLGVQYLWIDSLCIIQDDGEDWERESTLMEQVYSSAYVTIAASCASGTDDGFLKSRPERQCVTIMTTGDIPCYLCDAIDDFSTDVDHGQLNSRGWVLQERALSRRTIYFTEKQCYWECGGGVRCETLTKMNNRIASFLGDSNFPHSVESSVKGLKIKFYQHLYERYSGLKLTYNMDRPIAIRGLEARLIRTLKTVGGYGVFHCYFHRCLLWQRSDQALSRIQRFRDEPMPSWSWMAYDGKICYMEMPFGEVLWEDNVTSPFESGREETTRTRMERTTPRKMGARAHGIVQPGSQMFILDNPDQPLPHCLKCIILGTSKDSSVEHQVYYALITAFVTSEEGIDVYERVGVGFLRKRHIALEKPSIKVLIQ